MFPAYGMGRMGTEFINYPRRFMQILIMQLARCQIGVMASYWIGNLRLRLRRSYTLVKYIYLDMLVLDILES